MIVKVKLSLLNPKMKKLVNLLQLTLSEATNLNQDWSPTFYQRMSLKIKQGNGGKLMQKDIVKEENLAM